MISVIILQLLFRIVTQFLLPSFCQLKIISKYFKVWKITQYIYNLFDTCIYMCLRGGLWIPVGLTFVGVWRSEDNHRYLRVPATFCLRQDLSLAWIFAMLARLVGTACVCLPYSQCWDYRHIPSCLSFYVISGDLNSGPHAYKASTPPSEPSPKLHGSLTKDTFNWPPWSSLEVLR